MRPDRSFQLVAKARDADALGWALGLLDLLQDQLWRHQER